MGRLALKPALPNGSLKKARILCAVQIELVGELTFLSNYDATKKAIQEIVDMPEGAF